MARGLVSFPEPELAKYDRLKVRLASDSGRQLSTKEAISVILEVTIDNYPQALEALIKLRKDD
jgi:hypothetical protein